MGHRSVALTWSSVVDDRPDRSSQTGRRHRRNVWCECSSKSTHCSKVHGSYHPRTIGLDSFTRRPVWARRASHPAPSGRPPRGGAKVTWFRYSCEYRRYSREDSRQHTRDTKPGSFVIARLVPRVERVGSGHGGAVVLISRARSFVWCVTPRGARAFKRQAAAAAWWDVAWYVGRAKRHGVGFELFHDSSNNSASTPMAKPRELDEKCS